MNPVMNIVFGGLGGQGVVTASDIVADAAFLAGFDVKKSDIHGMAQRGGSVSSDVRFGQRVLSPMIPHGEADFLVVLDQTRIDDFSNRLHPAGIIISPNDLGQLRLEHKKTTNVALIALLSTRVGLPRACVETAIARRLKPGAIDSALRVFGLLLEQFDNALANVAKTKNGGAMGAASLGQH